MGPMSLPPGFRFCPKDDELVGYYLKRKVDGLANELEVIPVVDLYKSDPWELPEKSFLPKRDLEWFFFCPRDKKYPNGSRTNRATASGYWKATGKDRKIFCEFSVQGLRKTLVFYCGRAPGGQRTDWVMHEYRLCEDLSHPSPNFLGGFALCRIVKRNEPGLRIGDSFVDSKGKRSLSSSVNTEISSRKSFSTGMTSLEGYSSQETSLFEISNEIQPAAANSPTDQTGRYWGVTDQYLYNVPETNSLEVCSNQYLNSITEQNSMSISPVSSYASLTEEELNTAGYFSSFMSPSDNMTAYFSETEMAFPRYEWEMPMNVNADINGIGASNLLLSPLLCRQASDCEDTNLWYQDDSLRVVM